MADVFTPELTFGPWTLGIMTPTSPGAPYRTIQGGASIQITGNTVIETASANTVIGTPSVVGATGYTAINITSDPSGKFNLSSTVLGTGTLRTTGSWANTTGLIYYDIILTAGGSGKTDIVQTIRVYSLAVLGNLALSSYAWVPGVPSSGTVTGCHDANEVPTLGTGWPAGLTIPPGTQTWAWDGRSVPDSSGTGSLIGTHPQATNSPHTTSGLAWALASERILLLLIYGDSRVGGVYGGDRSGVDAPTANIFQVVTDYVTPGTIDAGYGTSHGLTQIGLSTQRPWQMYQNTTATLSHLSPFETAVQYVLDHSTFTKVVVLGAGWGGSHFIDNGAELTIYAKRKAATGLALVQAAYPSATIVPCVGLEYGVNDMTGAPDASALATALYSCTTTFATAIRSVSGWSSAPICGVAVTPEEGVLLGGNLLGDTSMRIAMLKDIASSYWCVYPTGIGQLHEGDGYTGAPEVRTAGSGTIGPMLCIALGAASAAAPTVNITDNYHVTELSSTAVSLGVSAPDVAYFTVNAGSTGVVTNTGDLAAINQSVGPNGGAWPAYTGTGADTIAYTENYISGGRYTGSVTRHVVVDQAVSVNYLAFDNFNRSNAGPSTAALGTTSGDPISGTGGSLTWVYPASAPGTAQIDTNQAALPWDGSTGTDVTRSVNVGVADQKVKARIAVASGFGAILTAGGADPAGANPKYGVQFNSSGSLVWNGFLGARSFGTFTALTAGTYDIEVRLDIDNDMAGLWIDGVNTIPMTRTSFGDDLSTCGNYTGIAMEYIGGAHRWDDFRCEPLQQFPAGADLDTIFGSQLAVWMEPADPSAGALASWTNKASANGFCGNAAQATGASQPIKSATSLGGHPGVTFDGTNDWMEISLTGVAAGTPIQVIGVFKDPVSGTANGRLITLGYASGNDYDTDRRIPLLLNGTGGTIAGYQNGFLSSATFSSGIHVVSGIQRSGAHQTYIDYTSATPGTLASPAGTPTKISIGGFVGGGSYSGFVAGTIAVVIGLINRNQLDAAIARIKTTNGL